MKPSFSLSGSLIDAAPSPDWGSVSMTLNVLDRAGVYLVSDALVGDVIVVDASAFEAGLTAVYTITEISSRGGTSLVVSASCSEALAPDLSWCFGGNAVVTRKVAGIRAVPAPGVQGIQDALSFAAIEANLANLASKIVISQDAPQDNDERPDGTLYFHLT